MRKQMKIRMATLAVVIGATSALFGTAAHAGPADRVTRDPDRAVRDLQRGNRNPAPATTKPVESLGGNAIGQVEGCSHAVLGAHAPKSGLCGSGGAVAKLTRR